MTAGLQTGFPAGYFVIRSVATCRLWDVDADEIEDGTEIILWPEKEKSLVEGLRMPEANNQVFFIDTSGALCSRSSGHAIDVEGDRLVLRHRRPVSKPFPNPYSHPLPQFSYAEQTGEISVEFASDPSYPPHRTSRSFAWRHKSYVISSIPMRKPRSFVDDASQLLTTGVTNAFSFLSGAAVPTSPKATPDEVFNGDIDLNEEEVLEQDRGEEGEVDDSPEAIRKIRVLSLDREYLYNSGQKAQARRKFEVIPLRNGIATRRSSTV